MLHVYILYNYHLVSFPRNTSCSKVLTATVPGPRSQHPQQARLRKPPGWLRELVLASATGHPQAGSDDVELPVDFFAPSSLLFYQQLFFQGSGPRGFHIHARACARRLSSDSDIAVLWYLSFSSPTFSTSHKKKVATVIYSIPSVVGHQKSRSQSRLILLVYPVPESRVCKSVVVYAVRFGTQGEGEKRVLQLRICTSIRTLTRALGPPPHSAQ